MFRVPAEGLNLTFNTRKRSAKVSILSNQNTLWEEGGQCVVPNKRGKGSTADGGVKKKERKKPRRPRMMWVGNLNKLLESS
jgi:hypothetical protein